MATRRARRWFSGLPAGISSSKAWVTGRGSLPRAIRRARPSAWSARPWRGRGHSAATSAGRNGTSSFATSPRRCGPLLVAEGDRRRVRIELHEPEPEEQTTAVLAIADYKKDLGLA
ncbi:phage terminase small subunit [Streptomyces lavendulae]